MFVLFVRKLMKGLDIIENASEALARQADEGFQKRPPTQNNPSMESKSRAVVFFDGES